MATSSRGVLRSLARLSSAARNGPSMARSLATQAPIPTPASSSPSMTSESIQSALQKIRSQPSHYVVASVVGRKYLLTPRDILTIPRLNDVKLGDTLSFTDIHELGSREYTLRGEPLIPGDTVSVKATVIEHTKGKLETIVKKKRRKGYKKTIQHKQTYTRLRIGDIHVKDGEAHVPL